MTFYQENTIAHEDGFGEVKVTVIISNIYDNLIKPYDEITDTKCMVQCFQSDKIKKNLCNSNGTQITDQIGFKINQSAWGAIETTEPVFANNQNCLFFCLQAEDTTIKRYVSIHIGVPSLSNMIFHGSINGAIPGEDKKHFGGLYAPDKYPVRDYSFTAKSYDAAMLKNCTFRDDAYNSLGARIDNIRERLMENDWAELKALFRTKFSFASTAKNWLRNVNIKHLVYFTVGNLGRVLQLILDKASDMIYDLEGTNITFTVEESDLGIQSLPSIYRLIEEAVLLDPADKERLTESFYHGDILSVGQDTDRLTRMKIYPGNPLDPPTTLYSGTSPDLWSAVYIDPSLVDEAMYIHEVIEQGQTEPEPPDDPGCVADWSLNSINKSGESRLNVMTNYGDVFTMLAKVAAAFGCDLAVSLSELGVYSVKIVNLQNAISDEIFIRGIKSGSINISSQLEDSPINFYSRANDYLVDGHDTFSMRWVASANLGLGDYGLDTGDPKYIKASDRISEQNDQIHLLDRIYSIKSEMLMFSLNSGVINVRTKIANLNEDWWDDYKKYYKKEWRTNVEANGLWHNEPLSAQRGPDITLEYPPVFDMEEWIHPNLFNNGLFIVSEIDSEKEPRIAEIVAEYSGPTTVIRPANKVYFNVDNVDTVYDTLGDYVNHIRGRDVQYFETEYEMEVPFINGFSLSQDGSNPSFKNLRLGSLVHANEKIRAFIADWEVLTSEKDYVVQGIEIDIWGLTTSINLLRRSRYRFTSIIGALSPIVSNELTPKTLEINNDSTVKSALATGSGMRGDAVKILSDGSVIRALPHSSQDGLLYGIALNDFYDGQRVFIQVAGKFTFDSNFSNESFKYLVVRPPALSHPGNVFDVPLLAKSSTEDQILILGKKIAPDTVQIEIRERVII